MIRLVLSYAVMTFGLLTVKEAMKGMDEED